MPNDAQPSTPGASNKMWYIIGGIIALLILGWVVTRGIGGAAMRAAGVSESRSPGGATTYSDSKGNSATVGATSYPDTWPSDAPKYGNGTLQFSGSSNPQTGKPGAAVMFQTSDSAQTVIDFYRSELTKNGWTIEGTTNAGGAIALTAKKDTRTFGAWAASAGGQTTVTAGIEM